MAISHYLNNYCCGAYFMIFAILHYFTNYCCRAYTTMWQQESAKTLSTFFSTPLVSQKFNNRPISNQMILVLTMFSSQGWCTTRSLRRAWWRWTCRGRSRRRAPPTLASTRWEKIKFWSKQNKKKGQIWNGLQACFVFGFSLCAFLEQVLSFIPSDSNSNWGWRPIIGAE